MKAKLTLFLLLFGFISICGQERFFVNASNGLNVRENATTNSAKVGKLPYGVVLTIKEETNITYEVKEDGETFPSHWVKIKYDNFPYLNANEESYEWNKTGFVVKHYLEKLNKRTISQEEIDSTTFYQFYHESDEYDLIKITSLQEVKNMLSDRVKWAGNSLFEGEVVVDKIFLPNGQTLDIDEESSDFSFIAYYPSEEILLFEGGHASDFSISIQTGETLETTGNPEYILPSPRAKFRLNGWFPGQECSSYFFQEKIGDGYTYITELDSDVCYFNKFCWLTDEEFIFSYTEYSQSGAEEKYELASITREDNGGSFLEDFKSELRPGEKLHFGKIYTDIVNYVEFNNDYDLWSFGVEKNGKTSVLVYPYEDPPAFVLGDQLSITWKIDSHRNAGDPEMLHFSEFLIDAKKAEE